MVDLARRTLLMMTGSGACLLVSARIGWPAQAGEPGRFPVTLSEPEWRRILAPDAYAILRREGTERPGSSPLNREHRRGTYLCRGCAHPLFFSTAKFESGTGWPSFSRPLRRAVGTRTDRSLGIVRTEVHCARCGGHLGHVFTDGPRPTGLRYCMNGAALRFVAA